MISEQPKQLEYDNKRKETWIERWLPVRIGIIPVTCLHCGRTYKRFFDIKFDDLLVGFYAFVLWVWWVSFKLNKVI